MGTTFSESFILTLNQFKFVMKFFQNSFVSAEITVIKVQVDMSDQPGRSFISMGAELCSVSLFAHNSTNSPKEKEKKKRERGFHFFSMNFEQVILKQL